MANTPDLRTFYVHPVECPQRLSPPPLPFLLPARNDWGSQRTPALCPVGYFKMGEEKRQRKEQRKNNFSRSVRLRNGTNNYPSGNSKS